MARASSITASDVATSKPPVNTRAVTSRSFASASCSASISRTTAASASSESARRPSGTSTAAASPGCRRFGCRGPRPRTFGKRRQQRGIDARGRKRGDEGRLLQFVDGLLDAIHQLLDDGTGVEALGFLAGFERDPIGLALDLAGADQQLAVDRAAGLEGCDVMGDRGGDIMRQADLAQHDREQCAVDAFQPPDQVGLDLVAHQPDRSSRAQRFGRDPHRGLEEIDRGIATERLVQPLAETDPRWCCVAYRGGNQFIAAEFEQSAMANPLPGAPIQNPRRIVLGDPAAQQLARLVPVDQEHQRCAERGEEGVAVGGAVGLVLSGDEKERIVLAESGRDMAVEPAPFRRQTCRTRR